MGAAAVVAGCVRDEGTRAADEGEVDVLVVGAGIAGLAAAEVVSRAGLRAAVLEARDRVGGRIWTSQTWAGLPVDLGASWIHGTEANPVYEQINRLGIATSVFDVGSFDGTGSSVLYSADGVRLDEDALEDQIAPVVRALESAAARAGASGISLRAGIDALAPATRRAAALPAVASAISDFAADYGATVEELALSALDEEDSFPGPQRVVPGGFGQLTGGLAEGLPVTLGVPVTTISLRDPRHVVVDAGGTQFRAGKVIVTVPLGVLKSGALRFDPELPSAHRLAISRLGFGRFEKLILRFEDAFWDDVDEIRIAGPPGAPFTGWYNLNRVSGQPVLMALHGGAAAAELGGMPVARQTALAAEGLRRVYSGRFRDPVDAQASDWWTDEFSRGSYSFTAVGSSEDDRVALGEPIEDRLWLAGEAQHPAMHSTVHGAYLSGQAAGQAAIS